MDWRDSLENEELKGNESLKSFENIDGLAKAFVETKAMVGNSIRIPSEEASDEDRAAFYNKLMERAPALMLRPDPDSSEQMNEFHRMMGVPEDETGYDYEGTDLDVETVNDVRELFR